MSTHEEELMDRKGVNDQPRPCRNCGFEIDSHGGDNRCVGGMRSKYEPMEADDVLSHEHCEEI